MITYVKDYQEVEDVIDTQPEYLANHDVRWSWGLGYSAYYDSHNDYIEFKAPDGETRVVNAYGMTMTDVFDAVREFIDNNN